jgi:cellulose synthase/poly-beta-1,6-N-acetylglucosamine synthase-like glycosyltransferase
VEYLRSFLLRCVWQRWDGLVLISGAFAAYRREALVAAGGFDAHSLVEDYEITHRLRRHAVERDRPCRMEMVPAARAITDAPGTPLRFLAQRQRWFAGFIQVMWRNRDLVGDPAQGRFGSRMLRLKTIDLLLPIYGMTATAVLIAYLAFGFALHPIIISALLGRWLIDLVAALLMHRLMARWSPTRRQIGRGSLLLATALEPLLFQHLRQLGAVLGWIALATRRFSWTPQR